MLFSLLPSHIAERLLELSSNNMINNKTITVSDWVTISSPLEKGIFFGATTPTTTMETNTWMGMLSSWGALTTITTPTLLIAATVVFSPVAGPWIFWLITSILLAVFQVIFISYQFIIIVFDVLGLSALKTCTLIRSTLLLYVDKTTFAFFSKQTDWKSFVTQKRKSVRRMWRDALEKAGSYQNFVTIPILEKEDTNCIDTKQEHKLKLLHAAASNNPAPSNKSNNTEVKNSNETASSDLSGASVLPKTKADMDPIVLEELGAKATELLLSTTAKLREARLAILALEKGTDAKTVTMEQDSNAMLTCCNSSDNIDQHHNNNKDTNNSKLHETAKNMKYLLVGVVKRNHLHLEDILVENARSISDSGRYGLSLPSRNLIHFYYEEVEKCLDWIAEASPIPPSAASPKKQKQASFYIHANNSHDMESTASDQAAAAQDEEEDNNDVFPPPPPESELYDRIGLVRKMKHNMGRTALMLSGGGAIAMYHLGVIRALIESGVYDDIKVISGTSGGSIIAAMCAIRTPNELLRDICIPTVATDFLQTGEQAKKDIKWFPPLMDMAAYWLKTRLLVDSTEFMRTCDFFYGDITFEEAFEKTGKHICINVSASRANGGGGTAQRLLLNHISTPRVTLASAVVASCSLPGVMKPAKLLAKNSQGVLEPFEVDGVEWIDGSVQADLPFKRISTLFAASSFIVSQVNFHIIPFLHKAHDPNRKTLYWRLFELLEWDIRNRALKLSRLGLFPSYFGQDISKVFKQRYDGNLTIVPRFTTAQSLGLKVLCNPTPPEMEHYLKFGQIATWPFITSITDMMRLEKALDGCVRRLEDRIHSYSPDQNWLMHDDMESIESNATSSRHVRIVGRAGSSLSRTGSFLGLSSRGDAETDILRKEMAALEHENRALKQKMEEMEYELVLSRRQGSVISQMSVSGRGGSSAELTTTEDSSSDESEGNFWRLVRRNAKSRVSKR